MITWTLTFPGNWVQVPDGRWLLITPAAFIALLAAAALFGYCWGAAVASLTVRRRRRVQPKRRNLRGVWS